MSTPYSLQLAQSDISAAGVTLIATVPADKRWVIREVTIAQAGTGSAQLRIVERTAAAGAWGRISLTPVMAGNTLLYEADRRYTLLDGHQIAIEPLSITGTFRFLAIISGYELDVP